MTEVKYTSVAELVKANDTTGAMKVFINDDIMNMEGDARLFKLFELAAKADRRSIILLPNSYLQTILSPVTGENPLADYLDPVTKWDTVLTGLVGVCFGVLVGTDAYATVPGNSILEHPEIYVLDADLYEEVRAPNSENFVISEKPNDVFKMIEIANSDPTVSKTLIIFKSDNSRLMSNGDTLIVTSNFKDHDKLLGHRFDKVVFVNITNEELRQERPNFWNFLNDRMPFSSNWMNV